MRVVARLAVAIALAADASARAEASGAVESIGPWRLAIDSYQRSWMLWIPARGTVARPDLCRAFALGTRPESYTPAEIAAIRRERAACLILSCESDRSGGPPRYEATVLLFGAAGGAYEKVPRGRPPLRPEVVLRLDDGPLVLDVGLIEPLKVQPRPGGSWSLVPFRAAPIERRALARVLASRGAVVEPLDQFFAAYIWVIPFTSAAYSFDLSGGADALTRLDQRCR